MNSATLRRADSELSTFRRGVARFASLRMQHFTHNRTSAIRGWLALLVWLGVCAGLTVYAADWPTDNRLENWIGQIETDEAFSVHRERFGGDENAVLRLTGCDLDSKATREFLLSVTPALEAQPAVLAVADAASHAKLDAFSFTALEEQGWLSGLDLVDTETRRLDFLVAIRLEATPSERNEFAQQLGTLRVEAEALGMQVLAAGHPLIAVALDKESKRVEAVFAPALALLSFIGTALFLRSLLLALITILPAIVASSGARAILCLAGIPSDLILVALGPLNFVLILAATLHFVTAFRRHLRGGHDGKEAIRLAVREKLGVGVTAAITTAVGFGVFGFSALNSVSLLGLTVACTVLCAVPLIFVCLAPLLVGLPLRVQAECPGESLRWWRASAIGLRSRYAILALGVLLLVAGGWSAKHLPTETNALHYFPRGTVLREDFIALEAAGRSLSSVDVIVRHAGGSKWTLKELKGHELEARLATRSGVRDVFGPRVILEEFQGPLASLKQLPALHRSKRLDDAGEWARFTVGIPTAGFEETRAIVDGIEAAAHEWAAANDARALVTGTVSRIMLMQDLLVNTLATSLAWTLLATTILFLFVVRSLRELLAAFFTNLLPVACTLTFAKLFEMPLDGATVMVAAVVLGLAVDNTFHILHSVDGASRGTRALLRAYDKVGEPATISSAGLTLGFLALAFSGFAPTTRFGTLCAVGALTALVADLFFLPVLWSVGRKRV